MDDTDAEWMDPLARYEPIVPDYDSFRAACERPLPHLVRVNTLKATVERTTMALEADGVPVTSIPWADDLLEVDTDTPGTTWPYVLGWIHGQEAVSTLPSQVLDPAPTDRIWDACAAPGSKTSQLAAAMDDEGRIVANDASLGRLAALRSNLERLGVTNAVVTNRDARNYSLKPFEGAHFDGAIVDAPCSGEGTVRKNPAALEDWSADYLTDVAALQFGILRRAIQVTRPGGIVVYSTCTFAPEENEAVLDRVLAETDSRLLEIELPVRADPGVTSWDGQQFHGDVTRSRRIWPHRNDTGGFFIAALEVGA